MDKSAYHRDTWVEVDLDAIRHNVKTMNHHLKDKEVMAVVKADAYGHGEIEVAEAALESGATRLAVAVLDEGLRLRQKFPDIPILVMGWTDPKYVALAAQHNITLTTFQSDWIKQASSYLNDEHLNVHLKVDTGMGRIGIRSVEEAYDVIKACKHTNIFITGVFTHFATADEPGNHYYSQQIAAFKQWLIQVKRYLQENIVIHIGNTAAAMRFPDDMFDAVRFGIGMYGLYPSKFVSENVSLHLKQAFSLYSRLIHVKRINKGDAISYGKTYVADQDEWIGTIPIGYGDGWIRKLQNFQVLIHGKKLPIVGRICMDQCMIRLDHPYEIGTSVTLIGSDQTGVVSMDDVADYLETINYEIPCILGKRIPRYYIN
ncbi:alanine racemase [Tenuibacillus multivorans]|uniref:Alanine racemase n=1 Tax=Tenuibacillus multivorans TaxID=237069 RepID=A0A1H0BA99_9BACI|nr:alanine racemase [Tenuibacillus multivorans]GEL78769.1 alanine racemase 1 [Tenuibacillus multivorans]SDN42549.1 alanine racemase [Tenuibacillus multivorans]